MASKKSQLLGYILAYLLFFVVFALFLTPFLNITTEQATSSQDIEGVALFGLSHLSMFVIFFALLGMAFIVYRGFGQ
jgi:hypothetical protein